MIWLLAIANWAPDQGLGNSFASATHSTNVPCAGAYGQCGGDKWNGAKCCPGTVCHHESIYYSQCLSDGTGEQHTGASQAASTHTTPTTSWQSAPAGKAHGSNAFASHKFYVGEAYQNRVRTAMEARWAEGQTRSAMGQMLNTPSAYWVDRIARIGRSGDPTEDDTLENLLVDAARRSPPQLVVVILYNMPNRDCHAYASNGEICCEHKPDGSCEYLSDPTCRQGLETYKSRYVDAFAAALKRHSSVPVVVVIEPDSFQTSPRIWTSLDAATRRHALLIQMASPTPSTLWQAARRMHPYTLMRAAADGLAGRSRLTNSQTSSPTSPTMRISIFAALRPMSPTTKHSAPPARRAPLITWRDRVWRCTAIGAV